MKRLFSGIRGLIAGIAFVAVLALYLFVFLVVTSHPLLPSH